MQTALLFYILLGWTPVIIYECRQGHKWPDYLKYKSKIGYFIFKLAKNESGKHTAGQTLLDHFHNDFYLDVFKTGLTLSDFTTTLRRR